MNDQLPIQQEAVLLISASFKNVFQMKGFLEEDCYKVQTFLFQDLNLWESYKYLERLPDVVIFNMDIEGDPRERVLHVMRFVAGLPTVPPVVIVSERDNLSLRLDSFQCGVTHYMTKHVATCGLTEVVGDLLGNVKTSYQVVFFCNENTELLREERILKKDGIDVLRVDNAAGLVKALGESAPHLVLISNSSGVSTRVKLLNMLNEHESITGVITLVVGRGGESEIYPLLEMGIYDFIDSQDQPYFLSKINFLCRKATHNKRIGNRARTELYERMREHDALNAHALVSTTDKKGQIIYANNKFCQVSGYSQEELLGENHRIIKSGVHDDEFYKDMWKTIADGNVWQGVICNRKKSGDYYWVKSTIVPYVDSNGKPYQYISIRTDISYVKETEKTLVEAIGLLERIYDAASIGYWEISLDKKNITLSQSLGRICKTGDKLDIPLGEVLKYYRKDEDRARIKKLIGKAISKGEKFDEEFQVFTKDSKNLWMRVIGLADFKDGKCVRVYGLSQDISGRKIAELKAVEERDRADKANKAKSNFLSNMSHELRTPMNAILGFSQLLMVDKTLNDNQLDNVKEVMRAGNHLLSLINEILDLSKVESGTLMISPSRFNLTVLIDESTALLTNNAESRGIKIKRGMDEDHILYADYVKLKQVLVNLLGNAIKYNRENGWVKVDVEADNNIIKIVVSDSGSGIPSYKLDEIYEPFNRLGMEDSGVEGVGIGLALSHRILSQMGGTIEVESELGKGSHFSLYIPIEYNRNI